jgi:trans-aconitate 2-methyltransferase
MPTWDAAEYLRFSDQRTRPCRDLADRVESAAPATIIDLGCGPGNSTAVLAARWPSSAISGLDSSPEMIAAARASDPSRDWRIGEIASWAAAEGETYDVVFSNAAIQWVEDHATTLPNLMRRVAPGGALAIQMPGNLDAPAHRFMRELAASPEWLVRFPPGGVRPWHVHDLPFYYDVLAPHAAALDLWQTEYLHVMEDAEAIVHWYKGTGLRPYLDHLHTDAQKDAFLSAYTDRIRGACPPRADGRVLFPFRRLFLIAYAPLVAASS